MSSAFRYSSEQERVISFERDLVVSAGAGSGKTRALVGVYCRLLADPSLPRPRGETLRPRNLLCLTFTNRAAGELRTRIRATLAADDFADRICLDPDAAPPPEQRDAWIRELETAPILTFHAFCAWLLRRHPLEGAIDPAASLLSEDEADDLLRRTVIDRLRQGLRAGDAAARRVIELEGLVVATTAIVGLVRAIRTAGWADGAVIDRFERQLAEAERSLGELGDRLRETVDACVADLRGGKSSISRRQRAGNMERALAAWWEAGSPSALDELVDAVKGHRKEWSEPIKEAIEAWRAARAEVDQAAQIGCWPAMAVTARQAYRTARRARGVLDYDALLLRTRDLLAGHADVRDRYRRRFRAILVDEHQDTDPVQHEILELLAGEALAGRFRDDSARWLVVGDAQQSIYGFRGAVVERFDRLAVAARSWDGHRTLATNYRSRPELLAFFNRFIPTVFAPGDAGESRYIEQLPDRPAAGQPVVELLDPEGLEEPATRARETRETEARALAARLRAACDPDHPDRIVLDHVAGPRVARAGDIVLLLRKLTSVEIYRRALQQAGFDIVVSGGGEFWGRQEVADVLHALQAALHREDPIPFVAYLRSPMVGLPDHAIWRLLAGNRNERGGDLRTVVERTAGTAGLEAEHADRLGEGLAILVEIAERADSEPPGATVSWLVDRTGYAAVVDALADRSQRRANLERLLDRADRAPAGGEGLLSDWIAALRRRIENPPPERDAPPLAQEDRLRILTIHQAKGLEFPVVALADMGSAAGPRYPRVAFHDAYGVVAQVWDESIEDWRDTRSYALAKADAADSESAEEARLLYVATTRARERLVLSGMTRTGSRSRAWLGQLEAWLSKTGDAAGVVRRPLAEWGAAFARAAPPAPPATPVGEEWREPREAAAPGEAPARELAAGLAAAVAPALLPVAARPAARAAKARGARGHAALQRLPLDRPPGQGTGAWLSGAGLPPAEVELLASLIDEDVLPRLQAAGEVHRERPFRLALPGGGAVSGAIDALWRDSSGTWWVGDYKFTRDDGPADAAHEAQLAIYALATARAEGVALVRGRLWYVAERKGRDFAWDAPALAQLERDLDAAFAAI